MRPSTLAVLAESRLPVGSSHNSSGGAVTNARASATRCRSPPDRTVGGYSAARRETDPVEGGHGPLAAAGSWAPEIQLGQHHVVDRAAKTEQVERLENETDLLCAQ